MICPHWLSWILTNPVRRLATNRRQILAQAGISGGAVVLEVGAGNGFFTEILAPVAAKLYVVELQKKMVEKLCKRLNRVETRSTMEIRVGDIARVDLPAAACDVAFVFYSFHELASPDEAVAAIDSALKQRGRVYLVEPRIEVSASAFATTLSRFAHRGFVPVTSWKTLFSRGTLLRRARPGTCASC